jgi:PAS domain S-box-containing protein
MAKAKTKQQLTIENEELRARLQDMEDTLEAIRSGAVDAIVTSGPAGDRVFTLEGADHAYHVMVETMNEGAVTILTDGTILYGNRQFGKMTGASSSGVVGRRFHEFVSTSDHPVLDTIIDKGGHDCPKTEISLKNAPGADIPVQIAPSPIELGGAKALTLVITDLSEQRRYDEIVAAEKLSRRILEQAQEAIAVCIDGCIVRANKAFYEICGSIPLMQPFDLIFSLRASESETFSVTLPESGKTLQNHEVRYQRPDGKIYDLVLSAGPLVGKENKVLGSLITMVDISERKRAEEALRESRHRLAVIVDSIADGFYALDREWRFTHANDAALRHMGKTREDIQGRTLFDVYPDARNSIIETEYAQAMESGEPRHFENPSLITERVLEIHAYPGNEILTILFRDVTEKNRLVAALRESEDSLRLANESLEQRVRQRTMDLQNLTEQLERSRHELRKLASELVLAEERERKRIAGVLHDEIAQTLAAARMRIDMLQGIPSDQVQRIEEVKALLAQSIRETRALMSDIGNPLLFDMGLKAACESLAERLMKTHPIRIRCDIRDAYKHLSPDLKTILYQVIRELLNNVAKHSLAKNAHVAIDLDNGHFRVKVTDDGVGFDPQSLGAPTVEGGFGLYSIRERLIAVEGTLSIESAPGAGTVVTAILPQALD